MSDDVQLLHEFKREPVRSVRRSIAATALLLTVWAVIVAIGTRQYARAAEAKRKAETETELAVRRRNAMLAEASRLEKRVIALQNQIASRTKIISSYAQQDVKGSSPQSAKASTDQRIAAASGVDPASIPPRVYICIPREASRPRATEVASRLQEAGYIVPLIELVREGPRVPTLKYFSSDGFAAQESPQLKELLASAGLDVRVLSMEPEASTQDFRPRHFELWFATSQTP